MIIVSATQYNLGYDIRHILSSSWPSLRSLDLTLLLSKSIEKYDDDDVDNPTRCGCRYLIGYLTDSYYPNVNDITITVRDSRTMFIFFAELFKAVNNDNDFRANFIGSHVNTIRLDIEVMIVQEHWQYQHKWNEFMKIYDRSYKPFPNIKELVINHWLPSMHLLTKVIGTNGINITISPGVEDNNLTSFLFDRWDPDQFPINSFIVRRRKVVAYCDAGYFINVDYDYDSDNITNKHSNVINYYRDRFRDEYQVDPEESYTATITNNVTNDNIVSTGIYRTILITKFNSTTVMGFHEKFLHFLGVFDTTSTNSSSYKESLAKVTNIISNCTEMKTMKFSIDRIGKFSY